MARVTSKGQVTIPIRKRTKLTDLAGSLSATREYEGKAAIRQEIGAALGRSYEPESGSR